MANNLPWSERVTLFAIHPDAASQDDIARLAMEWLASYGVDTPEEIRYGLVDEQGHFLCLAATPEAARQNIRDNYRAWKARRPKGDVVTFADYMVGRQYVRLTILAWDTKEIEP